MNYYYKLLCLFFCCMISNCMLSAQSLQYKGITRPISNRALDSAYLRITYSLLYISDSLKSNEVWEDRKILLIGDSINHFYSDYLRRSDSSVTVSIDKGKPYRATKFSDNVSYEGYDIYTYPIKRERIVWEHITDLSIYRYREKIEIPQWKISMDTCIILSYTCQKATAHFRGREWEVWFTLEIPIDVGPWKLCGLPGLILKASDSKGHYAFECIGLENLYKKKQPIVMIRGIFGELIECTRLEFLKAQGRFYDNYVNFLLTMGYNVNITDASGNRIEHIETPNTKFAERNVSWSISVDARDRNRKIPYNPIELE